jgi:hypothetical protein
MLLDSYLNYPIDGGNFPLNLPDIEAAQQQDEAIQNYHLTEPEKFEL